VEASRAETVARSSTVMRSPERRQAISAFSTSESACTTEEE